MIEVEIYQSISWFMYYHPSESWSSLIYYHLCFVTLKWEWRHTYNKFMTTGQFSTIICWQIFYYYQADLYGSFFFSHNSYGIELKFMLTSLNLPLFTSKLHPAELCWKPVYEINGVELI